MLQVSRAAAVAGVLAIASTARADSGDRFDAGTMAVQGAAGLGVGVGLGTAGGLIGLGAGSVLGKKSDWGVPLLGAVVGFSIGALVGVPLGVHYGGSKRDATGTALGTVVGELGGLLIAGGFQTIADRYKWKPPFAVRIFVGTLGFIGGPVIGYQLTNDGPRGAAKLTVPLVGFAF